MTNANKSIRLKITSVGLASILFSMLTTPAFALDRDANYGRTFPWSPYIDSIDIRPSNYYLFSKCYFHFDSTGANMNNSVWYFTMEQNNRIKDGLAMYSQFSNIPDPHFGYEDDNGDGYDEESEVSIEADLYKDNLVANTNYYFTTMWMNTKGVDHPGGTVQYIAQRSAYNIINGQYETVDYDYLEKRDYGRINTSWTIGPASYSLQSSAIANYLVKPGSLPFANVVSQSVEAQISSQEQQVFVVQPEIKSLKDLKSYKNKQLKEVNKIRKSKKNLNELMTNSIATITFDKPITEERLNEIINAGKVELVDCEGKFLNESSNWITGNFKKLDSSLIKEFTNSLIENGIEKQLTFEGITSARVKISLIEDSYEQILNMKDIYLIDVSDTLVKLEQQKPGKKLKVKVPDLAWEIDKIK